MAVADEPKAMVPQSVSVIDNVDLQQVQSTMDKIAKFQAVVQRTLKKDHDYGVIPGTGSKPTLLKPGAEKILMLMGLTSEYDIVEKVLDYEKGFFAFTVKCVLSRHGIKVTEGVGHANTREKRYISGKAQDAYTLANTVLKMAKKRAQVDATLTVASLSDIFTQDLEDLEDFQLEGSEQGKPKPENGKDEDVRKAAICKTIYAVASRKKIDHDAVHRLARNFFGLTKLESLKELSFEQLRQFLSFIDQSTGEQLSERGA